MTDNFSTCFAFTVGVEGGYTADPSDDGNWTGGAVGAGILRGTKYGISAASYPNLDIKNLTAADAERIYRADYWPGIHGDDLPLPLARVAFDAAVNSGVRRSTIYLQQAAAIYVDGVFGTKTMAALVKGDAVRLATDALCYRAIYLSGLPTWGVFGLGWMRRVLSLHQAVIAP
ncbi:MULTISPECIES: glycoside hydrolase family 108 protein [unclassified Acidocella]|uniref:glycoside hydrolase family 108 protein n=1 Tax=unclassified Acidocella TaxID=2648610 RepID=UPI00028C26B8|nr:MULTISPECIES: glycosyl hydrolase 108 family protein [unclassified Acidocella]EKN01110.1 hypothetical protein MXAZACID_02354 [Acidocella sp. MX-AZ02]WBO60559.1 hypothetical protein GT370_07250 [Acidocella sp. MX-AZ03]